MATVADVFDRLKAANYPGQENGIVALFASGSRLYGTFRPESDTDYAGVYVESPQEVLGLHRREHFTHSSGDNNSKNTSDDEDLNFHSLRHWVAKATQGNPTMIEFAFAPINLDNNVWTTMIVPYVGDFLCRKQINHFLGYADSQYKRLKGLIGRGKHGQRPELEAMFGYDTKMAAHMIRLMYEGIELMTSGKLTFPRPEVALLLDIRNGKFTFDEVDKMYLNLEPELRASEETSPLPRAIDQAKVSQLLTEAYLAHWRSIGLL
jgi:predicted nucleotidyltransferase